MSTDQLFGPRGPFLEIEGVFVPFHNEGEGQPVPLRAGLPDLHRGGGRAHSGAGPYGGLANNPMAVAGPAPQRFSLLAIAAHRVLLSAQAMFWGPIMVSSIAPAIPLSFLIHGGGIAAELLSLRRGYV